MRPDRHWMRCECGRNGMSERPGGKRDALQRLVVAESRVSTLEGTAEEDGEDVCLLEEDNERLRDRLGGVTDEADELRWQLEETMEVFAAGEENEEDDTAAVPTDEKDTTASNACNNLELERTKIKLSEVERSNRQLSRKLTAVQGVADSAVAQGTGGELGRGESIHFNFASAWV